MTSCILEALLIPAPRRLPTSVVNMLTTTLSIILIVKHRVAPGEDPDAGIRVPRMTESPIGDPLLEHRLSLTMPPSDLVMEPVTLVVRPGLLLIMVTPMNVAPAGPAMAIRLVRLAMALLKLRLLTIGPSIPEAAVSAGHEATRPETQSLLADRRVTSLLLLEVPQAVTARVAVAHPVGVRKAQVSMFVIIIMNVTTVAIRRP